MSDKDYVKSVLESAGIKDNSITNEDAALFTLLEVIGIHKKEAIEIAWKFIKSNNKYIEYLRFRVRNKANWVYDARNKLIGKYSISFADIDKVEERIKQAVCYMYMDYIVYTLSDALIIRFINTFAKRSPIKDARDLILVNNELDISLFVDYIHSIADIYYDKITPELALDKNVIHSFHTMKQLRVKNINTYIRKCAMLGVNNTKEYNITVFVELMYQLSFILVRIRDYLDEIDTGQLKLIIETSNKYGSNSKELDTCINRILAKTSRKKTVELRSKYQFITKEVMNDKELLSYTNRELAAINYDIKMHGVKSYEYHKNIRGINTYRW